MKNEIRLALLILATTAVPAAAQNASPRCGASNFDASRNLFTIINPAAATINQQCFFTVVKNEKMPSQAKFASSSVLPEGNYAIELSGGGGGGGRGAVLDQGGGGGGAGAAPVHVIRYLAAGTYKMTIGTGGAGGDIKGGASESGSPTSLTNADTGQLIAGFQGADAWQKRTAKGVEDGRGGAATADQSRGGSGGDSGPRKEELAQAGGALGTPGYTGKPGNPGTEAGRSARPESAKLVQANAGGGGGAGVGSGGAGGAVTSTATSGDLGGGGGGGRGGMNTADSGARGGHGFIRLSKLAPIN